MMKAAVLLKSGTDSQGLAIDAPSVLERMAADSIARGSRSFALAARIFPPGVRVSAHLIYAWCRHCDDRIDSAPDPTEARRRLAELEDFTARALRGDDLTGVPPVFHALRQVARLHAIPEELAFDLLQGMRMDVEGERYASLSELKVYCYRVAGVVGLMMARVMGTQDPRALQHARDLGEAMQLTNIARDVADDQRLGREYLPQSWVEQHGRVASVGMLLDEAQRGYASGLQGLAYLPKRAAWAVASAAFIYGDIGRIVRARLRDEDPWRERAVVSLGRKLWNVLRGAAAVLRATR